MGSGTCSSCKVRPSRGVILYLFFIREDLLDPLSFALLNVWQVVVSQFDVDVRNALCTRKVVRYRPLGGLLRAYELSEPEYLVHMLKAIKHLSMNAMVLEVLQNANPIEIPDLSTARHLFQAHYNLWRLNKGRRGGAGRHFTATDARRRVGFPPAYAGKSCRMLLRQHDGLAMYIEFLTDPYFQVGALESILACTTAYTRRSPRSVCKNGDVLVRKIEPSLAPALKPPRRGTDTPKSSTAPKRRATRRTASDTTGIGTPSAAGHRRDEQPARHERWHWLGRWHNARTLAALACWRHPVVV
ncbi:hypothetical protein EDB87DRAFT_1822411 [Lactarius vividus]|nr:hypothetical protein EDB87DRAFT_1822411 [Lactarius vividus]